MKAILKFNWNDKTINVFFLRIGFIKFNVSFKLRFL
jgi:hypothetical protein